MNAAMGDVRGQAGVERRRQVEGGARLVKSRQFLVREAAVEEAPRPNAKSCGGSSPKIMTGRATAYDPAPLPQRSGPGGECGVAGEEVFPHRPSGESFGADGVFVGARARAWPTSPAVTQGTATRPVP